MEKKFQVKLKNNRVLGPFDENQMEALYKQNKFDSTFMCKEFPSGEWDEACNVLTFLLDIDAEKNKIKMTTSLLNLKSLLFLRMKA